MLGMVLAAFTWLQPTPPAPVVPEPAFDNVVRCEASYYGERFRGLQTASGERFNPDAYTAAHRRLAFGTEALVVSTRTGKAVRVTINDRGPFKSGTNGAQRHPTRCIDLSKQAFRDIAPLGQGVVDVEIRY